MQFQSFDAQYVERLIVGDAETEKHFHAYFSQLLQIKLRRRLSSAQDVEDLAQEVMVRVFQKLRQGDGLRQPERIGSFVNSVCNNVLLERFRADRRHPRIDPEQLDQTDERVDLDEPLVSRERKQWVRQTLSELPDKDRELLRMLFLEEKEKEAICRQFEVSPDYLRVLLHRAKKRFREIAQRLGGLPLDLLIVFH